MACPYSVSADRPWAHRTPRGGSGYYDRRGETKWMRRRCMNMSMQIAHEARSYEGEVLDRCGMLKLNLRQGFAVVVSGAPWNPCGHLMLNAGGPTGYYCHIAERKGYPRYMNADGFARYLHTNGKREIRRSFVPVPNPEAAYAKLEQLLAQSWSWWGVAHNCASFVEEVLAAGGSHAGLYSNCPVYETFR